MESFVGSVVLAYRFGDFRQFSDSHRRVAQRSQEVQIAPVGSHQKKMKTRQAINALFHWGVFVLLRAISLFYHTVVLEKRQVVDRCFDS